MDHRPEQTVEPPGSAAPAAFPAQYLDFFAQFNQRRFFDAHEVLEDLWLETRHGADGNFYKGLIQFAAAFLHWDEGRPGPAARLFQTARGHLAQYPPRHHALDVSRVLRFMDEWIATLTRCAVSRQSPPAAQVRLELDGPPAR